MFRRCVCSLLLLTLVSSVAVESAQAESSPTTTRTHSRHAAHGRHGNCSRRTMTNARKSRCKRLQRGARPSRDRARSHYRSRTGTGLAPPTAIGDPPGLPANLSVRKIRCTTRYLRAAKQDGATRTQTYQKCRAELQRRKASKIHRHGYWATYLTTAYCLTGYTASGAWTNWGTVAATLPFGTRLYVPGYGNGTVLDRGGAVGPGHVDLYMPNCGQAIDWGVRTERIEIFT